MKKKPKTKTGKLLYDIISEIQTKKHNKRSNTPKYLCTVYLLLNNNTNKDFPLTSFNNSIAHCFNNFRPYPKTIQIIDTKIQHWFHVDINFLDMAIWNGQLRSANVQWAKKTGYLLFWKLRYHFYKTKCYLGNCHIISIKWGTIWETP